MDIFEFELRYESYTGLLIRLSLDRTEEQILDAVYRSSKGALTKKIYECSIPELYDATHATYTDYKRTLIASTKEHIIEESGKTLSEYIERLEYELKVIHEMGYNTYFLVVKDYITRSRDNMIVVGPGRGSCAGSLLSRLTGITDIDPLVFDLIFERFLNPGRISMPDIDTDFEDTQRDRVIKYITKTYGEENVAHIGTFMTLAAKAAFKDVARVYGVKFDQSNRISAMITEKTIQKSLDANKDLREMIANDGRIKSVMEIAEALEGNIRQTGVHACGMIIAPAPTTTYTAIQYPPKTGSKVKRDETRVVSQFEGPIVETIGLLKMDLLGLRNLSIIKHTIKIIVAKAKKDGEPVHAMFKEFLETTLFHPPLDDEYTYKKIFWSGDTSGVFQFESDGMKNRLKKLKPTGFDDLIAMVSLYRPGPMEFIPHYIDRKHGNQTVTYMGADLRSSLTEIYTAEIAESEAVKIEEDLKQFMGITYGIAVYQEQLMRIVQSMAGFTMSEADKLRKGVGKKIRAIVEKIKKEFIIKAGEHRDYKPETAKRVYEKMIEPAADYSFNKSHAACYAYISYQTAWLKAHYPIEFHAALLRSVEEEPEKLAKFIDEILLQGYNISLPSVNHSYDHVAAVEGTIMLGFRSIKGIGSDIAQSIEKEREANGAFISLPDFLKRCSESINKKSIGALVKAGALDEFYDRFTLLAHIERMLDWTKSAGSAQAEMGLFAMGAVEGGDLVLTPVPDEGLLTKLKTEFDVYRTVISQHPLDGMYTYIHSKHNMMSVVNSTDAFGVYSVMGVVKGLSRGMRGGFFLKVEDISGEMEFYITDRADIQAFDLIAIYGYKGRHAKIDKMLIFTHEELMEKVKASGRYDETKTVRAMRQQRMSFDEPKPDIHASKPEEYETQPVNEDNEPRKVHESGVVTLPIDTLGVHHFAEIKKIIATYPGDSKVVLGGMKLSLSQEGLQKLQTVVQSTSI